MKLPQFVTRWLRRSLENPNVSLQDPEAWNDIFGGGKAASGIAVNRDSALTYAAVWRAVNLISDYVATLPLDVFERGDDNPVKATKHPAFPLVLLQFDRETAEDQGRSNHAYHTEPA